MIPRITYPLTPVPDLETPESKLAHWESIGALDPSCLTCREEFYDVVPRPTSVPFMPRHTASTRCESGRRSHCTCDTCFTFLFAVLLTAASLLA